MRSQQTDWTHLFLMWALLAGLALVTSLGRIAAQQFPDPDDILRLIQVRDLLGGQGWFDLHQYRIDPTGGSPMHWSRLVDLPIAAVIVVLTPLIGQAYAEWAALIIVPLGTLLVAMLFVGHVATRILGREIAGWTVLMAGLLPLLLYQFQPLRIDHHGWQIACFAASLWGLSHARAVIGGAIAGVAMATGMLISLELIPIAALVGGVFALRWLRDAHTRDGLTSYLQALATSLLALFLATRGLSDLTPYCDAITLAHVAFFTSVALGVSLMRVLPPLPPAAIVVAFGAAGASGIAMFGFASPECLRTPFGALDPLVHDYWYVSVSEGRPVWEQQAAIIPTLFQLVVAFAISLFLWLRAPAAKRRWWFEFVVLFAGCLVLGLLVARSLAFASLLATIPFGWLLAQALMRLKTANATLTKAAIGAGALVVLLPTAPVALAQSAAPKVSGENAVSRMEQSTCDLAGSAAALARLPSGTVFAPLDIGPSILLRSDHSVVATGHHRAELAMRDVIATFLSPAEKARATIAQHKADYVVLCSDLYEPALYAIHGGEQSLAARLKRDEAPQWLEPVVLETPDTFRVWRVVRDD